jgi:hypothetical protein
MEIEYITLSAWQVLYAQLPVVAETGEVLRSLESLNTLIC